jgi:hypothetical protein
MALPAIPVVVSLLVSRGTQAAVKKYGKQVVEKALQAMNRQINPSKVKTAAGKVGKGTGREPGPIRVDRQGKEFAVFGREVIKAYTNQARNKGFAIGTVAGIAASGRSGQSDDDGKQAKIDELKEKNKKLNQQAAARMEKDKQRQARSNTANMRQSREKMGGR